MNLATAGRPFNALGRYRILAKLGQGGMADVYLTVVQGRGASKLLVAKVLREELSADQQYRDMFVKEARVATLLHHRNLVQTLEVDEADGHHFMTMEYLDGRPLHVVLATIGRERMPLHVHVAILAFALAGLHAAHEQKDLTGQSLDVVHRDVSPQNVFVTYEGEVKVVDFGVAKVRGVGTVTETGALIGKIGYMAPEQAASQQVDRRADVFAVGIMLWEALACRRFVDRGDGEAAALRKRLNGEIPSPRTAAPDAPAELVAICERAIAYDASERFETAAEFEESLNAYLEKQGARVGTKEIAALVGPPFEKDRAHVRELIEHQLATFDRQTEPIEISPIRRTRETDVTLPLPSESGPIGSPSPGKRMAVLATALGVALALLLAVFAWSSLHRTPTETPLPPLVSASVPSAPPPAATPSPTPLVHARIRVTPTTARLTLDGQPLPTNPFSGDLPPDGAVHVLGASAAGYVAITHEIRLDGNVDVDLTLVPVASRLPPAGVNKPVLPNQPRRPVRPVDDKDPYAQ
jgi:serine/threonine-protein kinase